MDEVWEEVMILLSESPPGRLLNNFFAVIHYQNKTGGYTNEA